jgi:hypothetical protein
MIMSGSAESGNNPSGRADTEERLYRLEVQVGALMDAVEALAHGLEDGPTAEPGSMNAEHAARRAHELLLLAMSASRDTRCGQT